MGIASDGAWEYLIICILKSKHLYNLYETTVISVCTPTFVYTCFSDSYRPNQAEHFACQSRSYICDRIATPLVDCLNVSYLQHINFTLQSP